MQNIILGISIIILMIAALLNGMIRLTTTTDSEHSNVDKKIELSDEQSGQDTESIKKQIEQLDKQIALLENEIKNLQPKKTRGYDKADYDFIALALKITGSYTDSEQKKIVELNKLADEVSSEFRKKLYHSDCFEDFLDAKNKYNTMMPYYESEFFNILEAKDYLSWKYSYQNTLINLLKERILVSESIKLLKDDISAEQQHYLYQSSDMIIQNYGLDVLDVYKESKEEKLNELYSALTNNIISFIKTSGIDFRRQESLQKKIESMQTMMSGTLVFERSGFKNNINKMKRNYEQGICQMEPLL